MRGFREDVYTTLLCLNARIEHMRVCVCVYIIHIIYIYTYDTYVYMFLFIGICSFM